MKKNISSHSPNILESQLTVVYNNGTSQKLNIGLHAMLHQHREMENLHATKLDSNPGAISAVSRQVRASEDGIQIDMQRDHY